MMLKLRQEAIKKLEKSLKEKESGFSSEKDTIIVSFVLCVDSFCDGFLLCFCPFAAQCCVWLKVGPWRLWNCLCLVHQLSINRPVTETMHKHWYLLLFQGNTESGTEGCERDKRTASRCCQVELREQEAVVGTRNPQKQPECPWRHWEQSKFAVGLGGSI